MEKFNEKLREYAALLVNVGMAIQPKQKAMMSVSVDAADLARLCAEEMYKAGASDVIMNWRDDRVARLRYLNAADELFDEVYDYQVSLFDMAANDKFAILSIAGSDPENLKGVEPSRIQRSSIASSEKLEKFYTAQMASDIQWCVGAYPTLAWAKKVFPEASESEAVEKLWDAIFTACRVSGDGTAVRRWQKHTAAQKARIEKLNSYNFDRLVYKNSLGTDLTVKLPKNHIWCGASEMAGTGVEFVANIPTEEVFTVPHRDGVDGIVYSSMPLVLNGNVVENFWIRLENGVIVEAKAEKGEEYLISELNTDEGARHLGEVALVPYSSPIRESGILFYNTLFDENASCHFAFGAAYPSCVEGASALSKDEQKALGVNDSYTHIDFMVGTEDLSITGCTADGAVVEVFKNGGWA